MAKFSDQDIAAILGGRRRIGRFPFPGSDGVEIGVRLLTESEIDNARFNAHHYLEGKCKPVQITLSTFVSVDPEALDREQMRQVLFFAIVDPDSNPEKPDRFFNKFEEIRGLDSVLVQQLWEIYVDWQDVVNPRLKLSQTDVEELADALKKDPSNKAILAHFERNTLQSLVRFLASQHETLANGKSSTSPNS